MGEQITTSERLPFFKFFGKCKRYCKVCHTVWEQDAMQVNPRVMGLRAFGGYFGQNGTPAPIGTQGYLCPRCECFIALTGEIYRKG